MKDSWNPEQYQKFTKERNEPFYDLVKLITPQKNMRIVDLGCGTGHLTQALHDTLRAKKTLGIDSSESMLRESSSIQVPNLTFEKDNIEDFAAKEKFDLVFSNAALQWVPDHHKLFKQISHFLEPGGQVAIQVPANFDYPTHLIAQEIAGESPFAEVLQEKLQRSVLKIEEYSLLLNQLGFKQQLVRCQVYGHTLESTAGVIEWVQGSLLTFYRSQLSPALYQTFCKNYRERIFAHFGNQSPFFMPFKRILIWARL